MTGRDDEPDDATPIAPSEREGLIPSHIVFRGELNAFEQQNILKAYRWAFARKRNPFAEPFLRFLHRRMFDDVWRWAGKYRTTPRNLGVEPWKIETEVHRIVTEIGYWIEHETYPPDEIAVRFHHGLVGVHPFANGNGRWSRLCADLAAVRLGRPRFMWRGGRLGTLGQVRRAYIAALKAADNHDIAPLVRFARS